MVWCTFWRSRFFLSNPPKLSCDFELQVKMYLPKLIFFFVSQSFQKKKIKELQCTCHDLEIQLDLGYLATSYPDIVIIRPWSCNVYCLFFIHFYINSCSKQNPSAWLNLCLITFHIKFCIAITCYKYCIRGNFHCGFIFTNFVSQSSRKFLLQYMAMYCYETIQ